LHFPEKYAKMVMQYI